MLLVVTDEKEHSEFHKSMLDLPTGEGSKTTPSRIATTLECSSVEMGSRMYGFYLWFSKTK